MDDDIRNSDNRNDDRGGSGNGNGGDYKPRSGAPENIEQMHSIKLENISPRTTKVIIYIIIIIIIINIILSLLL